MGNARGWTHCSSNKKSIDSYGLVLHFDMFNVSNEGYVDPPHVN